MNKSKLTFVMVNRLLYIHGCFASATCHRSVSQESNCFPFPQNPQNPCPTVIFVRIRVKFASLGLIHPVNSDFNE